MDQAVLIRGGVMRKSCAAYKIFNRLIDPKDGRSRVTLFWLFVCAAILVAFVFILGISLYGKIGNLGPLGDFIGGTLNPLLTFLTFMGLLITIVLQQAELTETRRELARSATALESQLQASNRQNFEATFFQMLTLHNTIVNSLDVTPKSVEDNPAKGREAFKVIYDYLLSRFDTNKHIEYDYPRFLASWSKLWVYFQADLGHYLRYLYNVIRFVDQSLGIPDEDKRRYIKLLRAQLSEYELIILYYNAFTPTGRNFLGYAVKYDLFNNLPEFHLDSKHEDWMLEHPSPPDERE